MTVQLLRKPGTGQILPIMSRRHKMESGFVLGFILLYGSPPSGRNDFASLLLRNDYNDLAVIMIHYGLIRYSRIWTRLLSRFRAGDRGN